MKVYLYSFLFCCLFWSCDKKTAVEKAVEEIPLDIKVERFDQVFFESKPQELQKIKKEYPVFFPKEVPDSVWTNKIQNPLWRELYSEVQKKYSNIEPVHSELVTLFKHIKYFFSKNKNTKSSYSNCRDGLQYESNLCRQFGHFIFGIVFRQSPSLL